MFFGKLVTEIWLVRIPIALATILDKTRNKSWLAVCCMSRTRRRNKDEPRQHRSFPLRETKKHNKQQQQQQGEDSNASSRVEESNNIQTPTDAAEQVQGSNTNSSDPRGCRSRRLSKPQSLYPASILGLAMVARGEIGFLVASLAESDGIFAHDNKGGSEMYLVVIWAITVCTILGPLCVGALVKRVQALRVLRANSGREDPLGIWGV